MKHLYWIICGAVIVALLVTWFIIVPTDQARSSKKTLDNQSKDLKRLEAQADQGDPKGVFDIENPVDAERLSKDYLITENWAPKLRRHVEEYEKQLQGIRAQLLGRKDYLQRPVAVNSDKFDWYKEYTKVSETLIARLRSSGCLPDLPPTDRPDNPDGGSSADLRRSIGLFTRSAEYPEPSEHSLLTVRLRTVELIADRLSAARMAVADNMLVKSTGRDSERARAAAMITSLDWASPNIGLRTITTVLSKQVQVRSIGLTLTLDGSLSALVSTIAGLEANAEADRPLIAVTSAALTRRVSGSKSERFDVVDDVAHLVLTLEVMVFAEASVPAGEL